MMLSSTLAPKSTLARRKRQMNWVILWTIYCCLLGAASAGDVSSGGTLMQKPPPPPPPPEIVGTDDKDGDKKISAMELALKSRRPPPTKPVMIRQNGENPLLQTAPTNRLPPPPPPPEDTVGQANQHSVSDRFVPPPPREPFLQLQEDKDSDFETKPSTQEKDTEVSIKEKEEVQVRDEQDEKERPQPPKSEIIARDKEEPKEHQPPQDIDHGSTLPVDDSARTRDRPPQGMPPPGAFQPAAMTPPRRHESVVPPKSQTPPPPHLQVPGSNFQQGYHGQVPPRQQLQQSPMQRPPPGYQQRQPQQLSQSQQYEQHYAQNQYQRRPDPPGAVPMQRRPFPQHHHPPQSRQPQQRQPGTLSMLWRRLERGLDGLADIEEAVSEKAKQLLSVPSIPIPSIPGVSFSKGPQSGSDNVSNSPTKTAQSRPGEQQRLPLAEERVRPDSKGDSKRSNDIAKRFGYPLPTTTHDDDIDSSDEEHEGEKEEAGEGKFELYKMLAGDGRKEEDAGKAAQSSHELLKKSSSPLQDMMAGRGKVIRANGGASQPGGNTISPTQHRPLPGRQTDPGQGPARRNSYSWREEKTNPFSPGYSGSPQRPQNAGRSPDNQRRQNPFASEKHSAPQSRVSSPSKGQTQDIANTPRPQSYDYDDDSPSILGRIASVLPPIPHISLRRLLGRGSGGSYGGESLDIWNAEDNDNSSKGWKGLFQRRKNDSVAASMAGPPRSMRNKSVRVTESSSTPPIAELLSRCKNGKSSSLLSDKDARMSRSMGRSRATLDVMRLGFLLLAAREIAPHLLNVPASTSIADFITNTLPKSINSLTTSVDSWAYYALFAAFLCSRTNAVFYDFNMRTMASNIQKLTESTTRYGQLYLRLVSAAVIDRKVPDRVSFAAASQFVSAVESARLSSFIWLVLSIIVLATVSVVRPVIANIAEAMLSSAMLEQWRHWPLPFEDLGIELKGILVELWVTLRGLVGSELSAMMEHPMRIAFKASLFAALFAVTLLPAVEQKRSVAFLQTVEDADEEDEIVSQSDDNFDSLAKLGTSSASRLGLMSNNGALEESLEQWRSALEADESIEGTSFKSVRSKLILVGYGLIAAILLALPPLVFGLTGVASAGGSSSTIIRSDSLLDTSVLVLFTLGLTWNALSRVMESSVARSTVASFLQTLAATTEDFNRSQTSAEMSLQLMTSISPTKGLEVRDLWAAHTAKRAWAVRGASLACRNGEVVVVLGDESAGKSRLLTAISEALVQPPRSSLSTTKVRGSILMGGLDSSKWDRRMVRKRLGLVLNDVRTVTDSAELLSGMTLEEILEPMDGVHSSHEPHSLSSDEKSCMLFALQISGLSASLLPKLPSKLSTVVTANEDELKPSSLRPRCNALTPSEWSKLLLARVLAQTIYDNDNTAKSSNTPEKSLVGSILLLDDVLAHISEIGEAKLIHALRRTGAATVLTSHKWATGRHADRIVVVKDGTIVEQGTHNELLLRGAQHSLYAAKWHEMTTV